MTTIEVKVKGDAMLPVDAINPSAYNPREITPEAVEGLMTGLRYHGLVEALIVNTRTAPEGQYTLVGGHQRFQILCDDGHDELPCTVLDINREDERALNILLNNQEAMGTFVVEKHRELVMMLDLKQNRELIMSTGHRSETLIGLLTKDPELQEEEEGGEGHRHNEPKEHACPACGHAFKPSKETRL